MIWLTTHPTPPKSFIKSRPQLSELSCWQTQTQRQKYNFFGCQVEVMVRAYVHIICTEYVEMQKHIEIYVDMQTIK